MDYGKLYTEDYYQHSCGEVDYKNEEFKRFFNHVADKIVNEIRPKTVLDVGCAMGYLVTALRDRGVEAYGIDVSEYAISQIRKDIRKFCHVQSALDPLPEEFPQTYDLLVTIEVIEHLYEEDGFEFLKRICTYADDIIFSSTPDDITEPTHFNVQQQEYWSKNFAKHGFLHQLGYDATYIAPQTMRFCKQQTSILRLVEDYERNDRMIKYTVREQAEKIKQQEQQIQQQQQQIEQQTNQYQLLESHSQSEQAYQQQQLQQLQEEVANLKHQNVQLANTAQDFASRTNQVQTELNAVLHSRWWRLTAPGRKVMTVFKKGIKRIPGAKQAVLFLRIARKDGFHAAMNKIRYKRALRKRIGKNSLEISSFITAQQALKQLDTSFHQMIKFSILVPLYNTPILFLKQMIDSCINQTYQNWELCLADASDSDHNDVGAICTQYARKDPRIVYQKLTENKGIADNTNAAIEMASGNYICLLDHDDFIHPSALFENMLAITNQNADFIYTDEMTFEGDIYHPLTIHLKPDFSIDNLRANNYICHFSTFSKKLLEQVGGFDPDCNGSQDYDMILRLTEQAEHIVHIPKILYFWRSHAASVASDISAKPYCITSAKKALKNHLNRMGIAGTPRVAPRMESIYKIDYELTKNPMISIIIPSKDHTRELDTCIQSILNKSTYQNYEIIIVENNSTDPQTFAYYETLKKHPNIQVITWKDDFNYSAINNYAVTFARGEYLLFLNNDIEIITPKWMEEMLMFAQRKDVGAVGAKLYFPDDTIQHAGVIIGLNGTAGHAHYEVEKNNLGYMGRLYYAQNFSAVTAACMMISKADFLSVEGFNPEFVVAFNDVDLCLKLRQKGLLNVFTPFAELYHYESKTRGYDTEHINQERFRQESLLFKERWYPVIEHDPYYNPNFSRQESFKLDMKPYQY